MQLDELTKLKQTSNSILNGIVKECRQSLNENLIVPLRFEMDTTTKTIRKEFVSKADQTVLNETLDKQHRWLEEQIHLSFNETKSLENKISKELMNYVYASDFFVENKKIVDEMLFKINQKVSKVEFETLTQLVDTLASIDTTAHIQKQVDALEQEKASKTELLKQDSGIRDWLKLTFPDKESMGSLLT